MLIDQPPLPTRPPSGLRRITLPMLDTMKAADAFRGLPGLLPGQVLAAFKAAAPFLGLRASVVHAVDWLFKFTLPLDWEAGSRPIVWPSAAEQQAAFGLSAAQVKCLNRQLAELGLVIMRDSPNGKRFGVRAHGRTGPIIEAYGFDLSPLATRMVEFQAIATEGKARRNRMRALRRRASIARNGLRQILAAAAESEACFDYAAWQTRAGPINCGFADITDEDVFAAAVARLERMRDEACEALRQFFSGPSTGSDPVETDPKGSENQPHITPTSDSQNPTDTVMARGTGSSEPGRGIASRDGLPPARQNAETSGEQGRADMRMRRHQARSDGVALKMTPDELILLSPKLRLYLPHARPTWPEIVEAADWLRGDLGISVLLWGDACLTLGRELAAVTVAIVSAKPAGYFRAGPAAYFFGMVRRAKIGELNLERTIWGLRAQMKDGLPIARY